MREAFAHSLSAWDQQTVALITEGGFRTQACIGHVSPEAHSRPHRPHRRETPTHPACKLELAVDPILASERGHPKARLAKGSLLERYRNGGAMKGSILNRLNWERGTGCAFPRI
jgi:hypothetical protein